MFIGKNRGARRAYGFDEIALVPASVTVDPHDVDVSTRIGDLELAIPVLASAMDGVVDVRLAIEMSRLGGLAVLNLEGLQTRYADPDEAIARIIQAETATVVATIQSVYREPIQPELVGLRVSEAKKAGARIGVSVTPSAASKLVPVAVGAGADLVVLQSTVTTAQHISSRHASFSIRKLCESVSVPVVVGNCVTYDAAMELMCEGVDGVLVGIGPGAACTTRRVLGLGVPQVTATIDVAAARDDYHRESGRRVSVITDGGMRTGGDVTKAFACGADAVMIGSPIASASQAPGKGHHWGMATSDSGLPRGTRIAVDTLGSLEEILLGPTSKDDGTMNLIGALKSAMGCCAARNLAEMQACEIVIAPSLPTEGKKQQGEQRVGMGK